jgi:hypothetical protein
MTGKVLRLCILLTLLAWLPAAHAESLQAPNPPDLPTFLATLHGPQPVFRSESIDAYCEVFVDCEAVPGYRISCSSTNGNCQGGTNWVSCDGVTQYCPACSASCACGEYTCYGSTSCSVAVAPHRVICDGVTHSCYPPRTCFE